MEPGVSGWGDLFYRVDSSDHITSVGGAWDQFARDNDGARLLAQHVIGTRLLTHVHGEASRSFVWTLLDAARKLEKQVARGYRCDSPSCRRHMEMRISPEAGGSLVVEHRLLRIEPLNSEIRFVAAPAGGRSMIGRCSMCNRLRLSGEWREVDQPEVAALAAGGDQIAVIYGVCPDCREAAGRLRHGL